MYVVCVVKWVTENYVSDTWWSLVLSGCCYYGSLCGPKIVHRTKSAVDAKRNSNAKIILDEGLP
jgi:hypothetical protein